MLLSEDAQARPTAAGDPKPAVAREARQQCCVPLQIVHRRYAEFPLPAMTIAPSIEARRTAGASRAPADPQSTSFMVSPASAGRCRPLSPVLTDSGGAGPRDAEPVKQDLRR
jgi:hypothetical protein